MIGKEDEKFRIQEYTMEYDLETKEETECSICGEVATFIWDIFHKRSFLVRMWLCEECYQGIRELSKKIAGGTNETR
jgi:uncharacterized protein YlaI